MYVPLIDFMFPVMDCIGSPPGEKAVFIELWKNMMTTTVLGNGKERQGKK